jgi:tetratricopeptide (TPR) repeat protein
MAKRWSESDLRFLRDNADKMDIQSLADRLGARVDEVEGKIEKLGLKPAEPVEGKRPGSFREMFKHSEAARKEYEKGSVALQKKKFEEAEKHFRALLEGFGDEKELADRARLYLAVCQRRTKGAPVRATVETPDEGYYAALVEKNRKNFQAAIEQLRRSAGKNGDGRVPYLMACCFAQMNDAENALGALERAISEDEGNRAVARRDPDFEPVRESPEFQKLTAATA